MSSVLTLRNELCAYVHHHAVKKDAQYLAMSTLRNEYTFSFFVGGFHHAMKVHMPYKSGFSKSMGSRDAQIEDIHVSPILKPVIARIPGAAAAVHPSAAPHILIIASGSVVLPEVDLPYADCPASIVFAVASREYDCVLLAVLPAFVIEKHTKLPLGNL